MKDTEIVDNIERLVFGNDEVESLDSKTILDFLAKLLDARKRGSRGVKCLCKNCKKDTSGDSSSVLCNACHQYLMRTGKRRPRSLWQECCSVCKRPRKETRNGSSTGLCRTCYQYRWRYGKDRPESVIKAEAPSGWCECGEPVTHVNVKLKTLTTSRQLEKVETYNLCDTCFSFAMEGLR